MHTIDICDSDRHSKISLISAVFEYAYQQSRLLSVWSGMIVASGKISPMLGKRFREDYQDMLEFYLHNAARDPSAATELMEYVGMDSDEYWRRIGTNLASAKVGFEMSGGLCVLCGNRPTAVAGMCEDCFESCQSSE